jgi:hypothetical protein
LAAAESQVGQKSFIGGISHFSFPADSITLLSKCRLPPTLLAHSPLTTDHRQLPLTTSSPTGTFFRARETSIQDYSGLSSSGSLLHGNISDGNGERRDRLVFA